MKIYLSLNDDGKILGWGSTRSSERDVEIEIEENDSFLEDNPLNYFYKDGILIKDESLELHKVKERKFRELSEACKEDILSYFDARVGEDTYSFSFDLEAQQNLNGTLTFFGEGLITEIEWTAYQGEDAVRLTLNEEEFKEVAKTAFAVKNSKISRLRNELQPLVENATTIEEVQAIEW